MPGVPIGRAAVRSAPSGARREQRLRRAVRDVHEGEMNTDEPCSELGCIVMDVHASRAARTRSTDEHMCSS